MVVVVVRGVAKISKRGSNLVISVPKNDKDGKKVWEIETIPLLDLELLIIVGSRVRISSGTLLMLSEASIPVLIHGKHSDSFLMSPFSVRIAEVRRRLYTMLNNPVWRVSIGRAFIEGKLLGMANLVRYLTYKELEKNYEDLRWVLDEVSIIENERRAELYAIRSIDELRVYEAKWSKRYWGLISNFIPKHYGFTGRNPKGSDPINSAISYAYAIIYTLCTHALIASGLDPYAGIVHVERAGRTSLTYDFSEMFKPLAIHSVIATAKSIKLSTRRDRYLTKKSLEALTRSIFKKLKKRHKEWKYTARGEIYAKAWELRQNIEKGKEFKPFIYSIK